MSKKSLSNRILRVKLVLILGITILIIFNSCKKDISFGQYENLSRDGLYEDTAIFVGKWNWVFTHHNYGWCDNESYYEYLSPVSEEVNFYLEFFEPGFLDYYRNDSLVNHFRISFQYFEFTNENSCNHFAIDLDGFDDLSLSGCIKEDTLKCYLPGFLFFAEAGCEQYVNYFVKE